jgi:hypothetical protein
MTLSQELELHAAVLDLITRRRAETGNPGIGTAIEQCILDRQLRMLEEEIMSDPGALEGLLVPLRRRPKQL